MSDAKPFLTDAALVKKQRAQERHFRRRALERFGLKLKPERYQHLIRKVTENANGTKFICHQPPDRTIWRIRAGGQVMRVVFDHTTDRLVTCLPAAPDQPERKPSRA
jgi:hypothetical protein